MRKESTVIFVLSAAITAGIVGTSIYLHEGQPTGPSGPVCGQAPQPANPNRTTPYECTLPDGRHFLDQRRELRGGGPGPRLMHGIGYCLWEQSEAAGRGSR